MKGRVVLLDRIGDRAAAAMMVDGVLEELVIDPDTDAPLPGAIYRAVADRPMKGQGGIFVKLPGGSGFLRQVSGIAPGQRLLVQVTGPTEEGKATPVTARLLFKSRFAIITPEAPGLNISRRIRDEEARADLSALATAGMAGADPRLGLILRSACAEAVPEAVAVARAISLGLDGERQLERVREVCLRTADNRASMLQDILRGRPTEIDAINGAVVARGRAAGVDTPVNLLLTQLVQALEATVADRL